MQARFHLQAVSLRIFHIAEDLLPFCGCPAGELHEGKDLFRYGEVSPQQSMASELFQHVKSLRGF